MTLHEVSILRTEGRCVFLDHIYIGGKSEGRRWSPELYGDRQRRGAQG